MIPGINETGLIGLILGSATTTMTGTMEATLIMIFMLLIIAALAFNIPLEYLAVILLPLTIATAAGSTKFMIPLVVFLIYIAAIITKNYFFK